MAWISGENPLEDSCPGCSQCRGPLGNQEVPPAMKERLNRAGFLVGSELVELKGSKVLMVVGTSEFNSQPHPISGR